MCKYCDIKERYDGYPILAEGRDEFTVKVTRATFSKRDCAMLGINHDSDFDDVEIYYCPMCGRRLSDVFRKNYSAKPSIPK